MSIYRCDFEVQGDLVLPVDRTELGIQDSSGTNITFKNGPADQHGHPTSLEVIVIAPANSLEVARDELWHLLNELLDLLTFATDSRFEIIAARRLIEWEPHQDTRRFQAFHPIDPRHPPRRALCKEIIDTISLLDEAAPPAFARTALRHFRKGVLDDDLEDQFMRFWLALEIIAENTKSKTAIPVTCPKCFTPAKCHICGEEPKPKVPMAKQAIENLIANLGGKEAQSTTKKLVTARNGFMHGRSRKSIEKECKTSIDILVNQLGAIAWDAIMTTISVNEGQTLVFTERLNDIAAKSVIYTVTGAFGGANTCTAYPPDEQIPKIIFNTSQEEGRPAET